MRKVLALSVVLGLLTFGAGTASAAIANFKASLTGTYSTSGTATETGCWKPTPDDDGQIPLPDQSWQASETDTFTTVHPNVIQVGHIRGEPLGSGRLHENDVMRLKITGTRNSTENPGACTPSSPDDPTPDCGTKARTYSADIVGPSERGQSLGFTFIRAHAYIYQPGGLFNHCDLVPGQNWMGFVNCPMAKASLAKLYNPRVHKIVLKASISSKPHNDTEGQISGSSSYSESYKLTLIRIRGTTHT